MVLLGDIRCKGSVVTVMDVLFASAGFDMASYHTMRDKLKAQIVTACLFQAT